MWRKRLDQMNTSDFADYPGRFQLSNELHARPFPKVPGAGYAVLLALKSPDGAPDTREKERAHLIDLLNRFGATHPAEGANHYYGKVGRFALKWERHSEFVTFTFFVDETSEAPFVGKEPLWPEDWAERAPGKLLTAVWVHIAPSSNVSDVEIFKTEIEPLFEQESIAVSVVLDETALIASDFRIDTNGFVRVAVLSEPSLGERRRGRIIQRLMEIETYKSMAMLSLPDARAVSGKLGEIGPDLAAVVQTFAAGNGNSDDSLNTLLDISATLETLAARHTSRFTAAEAYSAIVEQRIQVLRERRFHGRQTFGEFMMRRFDPAMRTCGSTARRLASMTQQAARAGDMLRTRTDVARAEQNQAILSRMDDRAAQQLKLQKTVEGLSVVAVSYYAVNLAVYLLGPLAEPMGISKVLLAALVTIPTILIVWLMIRSIRRIY